MSSLPIRDDGSEKRVMNESADVPPCSQAGRVHEYGRCRSTTTVRARMASAETRASERASGVIWSSSWNNMRQEWVVPVMPE